MEVILKNNKTYKLFDFFTIPLKICPWYTLIIAFNRIINALKPSFTILVTADFVDTALSIFKHESPYHRIFIPLILYMVIVFYTYLHRAFIRNFIEIRYNMRVDRYVRSEMIKKRAKLEYKHIESDQSWDLITRTCKDPRSKIYGGMDNLLDIMDIILRVGSMMIIIMTQVWWAALVIFIITFPLLILAAKGGKEIYESIKESEKHRRRADYLHKVLSDRENVEERSMFGFTDEINKRWLDKYESARKITLKADLKYFIRMKSSSLITVIISIGIIGFLLLPLSQNMITIGMFMALTTATLDLVQMMSWHLSEVVRELAKGREYLSDLTAFMGMSEKEGAIDLPASCRQFDFESIEFIDVSFRYPDTEKYILKNFNLRLEKNLHYAFVGVNGAGKTTLTKLLTGLYDNYTGDILINGKNIRDYKLAELKAIFSVVNQDFAKYYVSMKDNILLGNVHILEENKPAAYIDSILNMAYSIGLKDAIQKIPNGIDSYLGKITEGGTDLSGGEWQRLAIARTLFNPAFVRILDEPTAALDPVAESNIYELFGKISANKTTIFITHRLGGARLADEIIVIDEGRVLEKGSHDYLISLGGIYAEMYESQRSWYQE